MTDLIFPPIKIFIRHMPQQTNKFAVSKNGNAFLIHNISVSKHLISLLGTLATETTLPLIHLPLGRRFVWQGGFR